MIKGDHESKTKSGLTKRAPDKCESPRFQAVFVAWSWFPWNGLSYPARQPLGGSYDFQKTYLPQKVDVTALDEEFLSSLVTNLVHSNTIAIILGGSHVRGETTVWSDVDVLHLVTDVPSGSEKTYQFTSGHLVSIATRTLTWYQTMLTRPEQAIFIVPALREAGSLFDPQRQFHTFQQQWKQNITVIGLLIGNITNLLETSIFGIIIFMWFHATAVMIFITPNVFRLKLASRICSKVEKVIYKVL